MTARFSLKSTEYARLDCAYSAIASIMESILNLHDDLARVKVVGPAKSEAVVQKNTPVCDVHALHIQTDVFADISPERKIECRVGLQMIAGNCRITVCEAGTVIDVRRRGDAPG